MLVDTPANREKMERENAPIIAAALQKQGKASHGKQRGDAAAGEEEEAAVAAAEGGAVGAAADGAAPLLPAKRRINPAAEAWEGPEGEDPGGFALPPALKSALRDDWEAVVRKRLLHRLPCEPSRSAAGLVGAYLDFLAGGEPPADPTKAVPDRKSGV